MPLKHLSTFSVCTVDSVAVTYLAVVFYFKVSLETQRPLFLKWFFNLSSLKGKTKKKLSKKLWRERVEKQLFLFSYLSAVEILGPDHNFVRLPAQKKVWMHLLHFNMYATLSHWYGSHTFWHFLPQDIQQSSSVFCVKCLYHELSDRLVLSISMF